MKKSILCLGKSLSKNQLKKINGSDTYYLPICECNAHGVKINQPCEGGCVRPEEDGPLLDICDALPDLCV